MARLISILFAAVLMLSGCGYSMQGRADLPFNSVVITGIKNATAEPKLQDRMHRLLAETFMEYGIDIRSSGRYTVEGTIEKFVLVPIAEQNLSAIQYQITITGTFKVTDTETKRSDDFGVSTPYITYFKSSGFITDVIAAKEQATEKGIKDLSQELVQRIIYKYPKPVFSDPAPGEKGKIQSEPKAVPSGK